MKNNKYLFSLVYFVVLGFVGNLYAATQQPAAKPRQLSLESKPWQGDFDQMLETRRIRVLVPYSRSLYFVDKGRERGVTATWYATSSSTSTRNTPSNWASVR